MEQQQKIVLEACVGSYIEAQRAEQQGADRIELCDNLQEGGTTPSYGTIYKSKKQLSIPIWVIIRPRGGNFVYGQDEIEIMRKDIEICKQLQVDGIVLGCLLENQNKIDEVLLREFIELASPMQVCFHMAFDELDDYVNGLQILIECGVVRVLTKGGKKGKAIDNLDTIKMLVQFANGNIQVMPGGGVTKDNYLYIIQYCSTLYAHGTKIVGNLS